MIMLSARDAAYYLAKDFVRPVTAVSSALLDAKSLTINALTDLLTYF